MNCACKSPDAHNCWALRYYGHTGVSELTVNRDGGPCECMCHEIEEDEFEIDREHRFNDAGFDTCRFCGEREAHKDHTPLPPSHSETP